jgi:hypothetical protein
LRNLSLSPPLSLTHTHHRSSNHTYLVVSDGRPSPSLPPQPEQLQPPPYRRYPIFEGRIARINAELVQASEERAQAVEYGLVILEEKQNLQIQFEELSDLYATTKRELKNSTDVSEGLSVLGKEEGGGGRGESIIGREGWREHGVRGTFMSDDLFQLVHFCSEFVSSQSLIDTPCILSPSERP